MTSANFPSAPIWRRLAALLYDSFILLALSFCYGAIATFMGAALGVHAEDYQPMFHHWLFTIGWIGTLAGFYYWFWRKSGQTIGMRTWRIQLCDGNDQSQRPSGRQCLLRMLFAPLLILLAGVAYWYRLLDRRGACLHDRLSHTQVVVVPKNR